MAKMNINELKLVVAEILDEAKKKVEKNKEAKKKGASIEAYGLYDEAFDYSNPLGALSLYAQQGAVNWGPYTSRGDQIDSSFRQPGNATQMRESDERALRVIVREVIENGLVPTDSAWAPVMERRQPMAEGTWGQAAQLVEAWYDKFKSSKKSSSKKSAKGFEKASSAKPVQKHGFPPKKK